MKISIVVPVYKVEKYISRCIESILMQTYEDIELILVDDGSPDNSGKICEDYAKKDSRIKVLHKQNGGPSDARNTGLEIATGDYIMYVDSDDYIEKYSCEELAAIIKQYQADIVCFNLRNISEEDGHMMNNNGFYRNSDTKSIQIMTYEEAMIDNLYRKSIRYEAVSKIYKRQIAQRIKFPVGMLAEDFATFYKYLKEATKIVSYDRCLYNYVIRKGSIMGEKKAKLYADVYKTEVQIYELLKDICRKKEEKVEAERRYFRSLAKIYAKLYKISEYQELEMTVKTKIEEINFSFLKFKEKVLYSIFLISKPLFVWGMKKVYQKL